MKQKVIVFLMGGLGNQMFQYATGFDFAKKIGGKLILDKTFLNDRFPRLGFTYREYNLDIFDINPEFTKLSKISGNLKTPGIILGINLVKMKFKSKFCNLEMVRESDNNYFSKLNEAIETKPQKDYLLLGYWQTLKYFKDSESEIKREFSFKKRLIGEAEDFAYKIENTNSVSIHIRRGDYITSKKARKFINELSLNYYIKAIEFISKTVKNPHFFVFSDDIEWCKKNLKIDYPTEYISKTSSGEKNEFHLELMSRCKHNIIANSTFSWWGAWLNKNPNKIVIAPKKWFNSGDNDIVHNLWNLI